VGRRGQFPATSGVAAWRQEQVCQDIRLSITCHDDGSHPKLAFQCLDERYEVLDRPRLLRAAVGCNDDDGCLVIHVKAVKMAGPGLFGCGQR
jgi:hypothetical protein